MPEEDKAIEEQRPQEKADLIMDGTGEINISQ